MSEMSPEMMPEMINPIARPKIMAPAASKMARIVARMFSIALLTAAYQGGRPFSQLSSACGGFGGDGALALAAR